MFAVNILLNFPLNVITATRHYRYVSRYYVRVVFTVPSPHAITVKFPRPRGKYRGYRGITVFPITVSSSICGLLQMHAERFECDNYFVSTP